MKEAKYVCPPCAHSPSLFDSVEHSHDGHCEVCGMPLVEAHSAIPERSLSLHSGSGSFRFPVGADEAPRGLSVFYYMPSKFSAQSPILWVIPGAGRNAWSYRDNWIELAEKYNVLILSPYYPKEEYDFAGYHLAGMVESLSFKGARTATHKGRVNKYFIDDEALKLGPNTPADDWIFHDFDSVFDAVVLATGSNQTRYDMFGHSAGGRIVHRLAVFYPQAKAHRLMAANSGAYTLPTFEVTFPFGLRGTEFVNSRSRFEESFSTQLTVLVGELDNATETRGTMLHTPTVDKQGLGRLERGQTFLKVAQQQAEALNISLRWQMHVVPEVGHQNALMAEAAAKRLYE